MSDSGAAAASASASASSTKRRHEKTKRSVLDPLLVTQYRGGHTRLINIRDFASRYTDLQSRMQSVVATLANEPEPDLSVADLAIPTPWQAIDRAIDAEVVSAAGAEARTEQYQKDQLKKRIDDSKATSQAQRLKQQQQNDTLQKALAAQPQYLMMAAMNRQLQQQQLFQQLQLQQQQAAAAALPPHQLHDGAAASLIPSQSQNTTLTQSQSQSGDTQMTQAQQHHDPSHPEDQPTALIDRMTEKKERVEETTATSNTNQSALQENAAMSSLSALPQLPSSASSSIPLLSDTAMIDVNTVVPSLPQSHAKAAPAKPRAATTLPDNDVPEDFGDTIPNYEALIAPLQPLLEQRSKLGTKRNRIDNNSITTKSFHHDIKTRTQHTEPVPLPADEVILRVSVYHPTNYSKSQEFIVCGSSTLTSLRDRIYCLHDHILDGPQTPSACFFIEGKFYNDMRDRRAIAYSSTIMEWIKSDSRYNHPGLAHFDTATMEATTFAQLSIRLGAHYMYQHQGDCVHTIVFTQLRMAHSDDIQNILAYPLKPYQSKTKRRKCRVCDLYPAAYVTYGDKLANENPFFYCEECYRPMHYSTEGNLLYNDFQVYSYEHE